jgi:hypothetical protein
MLDKKACFYTSKTLILMSNKYRWDAPRIKMLDNFSVCNVPCLCIVSGSVFQKIRAYFELQLGFGDGARHSFKFSRRRLVFDQPISRMSGGNDTVPIHANRGHDFRTA